MNSEGVDPPRLAGGRGLTCYQLRGPVDIKDDISNSDQH